MSDDVTKPFSGPIPIPDEVLENDLTDADVLTFDQAVGAKAKAEQGYWYRLPRTGGKALVRRITSADRIAVGSLPAQHQQRILNALAKVGDSPSPLRSDGSVSTAQWQRNAKTEEEIINCYCVAGFIKPRIVFTLAERRSDDDIPVEVIDPFDRRQFFLWSETGNEAAAAHFRAVVDEPIFDVEDRGAGGVVEHAPIESAQSKKASQDTKGSGAKADLS